MLFPLTKLQAYIFWVRVLYPLKNVHGATMHFMILISQGLIGTKMYSFLEDIRKKQTLGWITFDVLICKEHFSGTHLCTVFSLLSVFVDLLRFTTILLPCCKGQKGTNGRPYLFFASSTPDLLSFCLFVQRRLTVVSSFVHIIPGLCFLSHCWCSSLGHGKIVNCLYERC